MSKVERMRPGSRSTPFRLMAAGATGLFLMATAYQAAFAGSVRGNGFDYGTEGPPGPRGPAGDDASDTLGWAAVGVGGAALLVSTGVLAKVFHKNDSAAAPELPRGKKVAAVRLTPSTGEIEAGSACAFDLQAQGQEDGKWYSVTARPEASLAVRGAGLVKQDGTKNAFCLPVTATKAANGQKIQVVGTYTPEGQPAMSATATLTAIVPAN